MKAHIAVISSRRPGRVGKMQEHLGRLAQQAVWYVGKDEAGLYADEMVGTIVESGGLVASRNRALEDAFDEDLPCVQLSDDLMWVKRRMGTDSILRTSLPNAIEYILGILGSSGAKLGGAAATDNPYFAPAGISSWALIVGDLSIHLPNPIRYDPEMPLKEDFELSIQHLQAYGEVCRVNDIIPSWLHRTNAGGAVAYRTPELEQEAIDRIKELHPGWIRDNPRRNNEILLVKKPKESQP